MITIDALKHNKFQNVNIPKASDLFARVGARAASSKDYSGDEFVDPSVGKLEGATAVLNEVLATPIDEK